MRPVLVGLLAAATAVSASECVGNTIDDIVAVIPCGDEFVSKCLHKHVGVFRLEEIEPCFIAAGCSKEDAVWFTQECNVPDSALDLKKRATSEESTTAKTTAKTSSTSAKKTSTTAPSSTDATTTSSSTSASSTTSSTLATSTSSTTSSTSSDSGTSNVARATTNSGTNTGTLACSVTSTKDTSFCSMTGDSTLGCVATTTLIASCAPGNLCTTDAAGANVCMKKDDHLTTSGLIVTIALAIALAATIISLVALACIQRSKAKKDKMEAAAKLGGKIRPMDDMEAKPYKIGGGGESSEADLPLIAQGGKRSPQAGTGAQQGYFEQGGSGSNSVSPGQVPQIQLHQGLGALGQDTPPGQHWSSEYAARSR